MRYALVASLENNHYCAWQGALLTFSARTRLGARPVLVVHATEHQALLPDLARARDAGAHVLRARSYRLGHYAPSNTPGTLLEAARALRGRFDAIVLLDPDMVFTRAPELPRELAADTYPHLHRDAPPPGLGPSWEAIARSCGVAWDRVAQDLEAYSGGTAYTIPLEHAEPIALRWLAILAALRVGERPLSDTWMAVMNAGMWAMADLRLRPAITRLSDYTCWHPQPARAPILHYAFGAGEPRWDKRAFMGADAHRVWSPPNAPAGTILGELVGQLREAATFYGLSSR